MRSKLAEEATSPKTPSARQAPPRKARVDFESGRALRQRYIQSPHANDHQIRPQINHPRSFPGPTHDTSQSFNPRDGMPVIRSTILDSTKAKLAWSSSLEGSMILARS